MGAILIGSLLGVALGIIIVALHFTKVNLSEILFLLAVFGLFGLLVCGQIIKQIGTTVAQHNQISTVEHITYSAEIDKFPNEEVYYVITGEYYAVFLAESNRTQRVSMNDTTFRKTAETPKLAQWERCYSNSFYCWLLGPVETGYTIYLPTYVPFR